MIKISPAILQDASIYLFKADSNFNGSFIDFFSANRDLFCIKTPSLIQKFVETLSITPLNFSHIVGQGSLISIKKEILIKYIKMVDPPWRSRITWGIKLEVFEHLKERRPNLYRCLRDCQLISEKHDAIVWWYENLAYNKDSKNAVVGAMGERLSEIYENEVLGIGKKDIDRVSLKKSNIGYDILSVLSKHNDELKPIEVKASTRIKKPLIYITENEWKKSSLPNYIFHFWLINKNEGVAQLYFIEPVNVEKHIPANRGGGSWVSTKIDVKKYCKDIVTTMKLSVLFKQ